MLALLCKAIQLAVDVLRAAGVLLVPRTALIAENLFLRRQLALYQERNVKPRRIGRAARIALVYWSRFFNWRDALVCVRPRTLISWHRAGFRALWRWKSGSVAKFSHERAGAIFYLLSIQPTNRTAAPA